MRWAVLSALLALLIFAQSASAQAGRLAFGFDGDIWAMRVDGSQRERLTRTPGEAESGQPAWSPDGTKLAFARGEEPSSIWVLAGGSDRRLTNAGGRALDQDPGWKSDGRTIAFVRHRFGEKRISSTLLTIDSETGRERKLASVTSRRTLVFFGAPRFSPDGTQLLYTRTVLDRKGTYVPGLYVLDVSTGKSRRLAAEAATAAWSPDGRRIAFSSVRDRNGETCGSDECSLRGELYVMNADGSGQMRLTNSKGHDGSPTWAPDGRAIAFASTRNAAEGDKSELYAIKPDGSCLTWLTNSTKDSYTPDWQPGSGGLPEGFACGAVPREPTDLIQPEGRGLWLGPIGPRNVMLSDDDQGQLPYDDCAVFEPRECGPVTEIGNSGVCRAHPLTIYPESQFSFEVRRGALVYHTAGDALVYSGASATTVSPVEPAALDALRPLPSEDAVAQLSPPRFPAGVIKRIDRARRLGTVTKVRRSMHLGELRARQLLALAQAVEPLGQLQPADC